MLALAGLTGWLGYRQYEVHQIDRQREIYLQAGRQGALNLTTISYAEVDADIQRILDSSTGAFHNDFHERSKPFVDVVKRDRSKSEGTVTQAAVQSMTSDSARVLVTVLVNTTTAAAPQPHSNSFRMRIDLQQVGDDTKVSNVEFI
ncbi:MAG: hypothetical protein JO236_10575 [Mycobacterium sp.]|uniref:hypothetical protein n=1 Tax=Mycobacterium sp. TaxID=1785 RepID=UPI001EB2C1FD|nr:hypothetical protein [Mycobacterium sp.]MBW0017970.1 hypothetical protein [Mycobacterium sp.]